MSARIRINWNVIHELLKSEGIKEEVKRHTRRIDAAASAQGSQTRIDFSADGERARGAVIAGYEDGATAESTRRILLGSLDGADG
ncbi:hypothetical protein AB0G42_21465 [Streptomyces yangpuensis]|uniref:hypothetical protein n=1 Tax=Streptomyces yangpuensis TaxID=1648182 RepID=UPI0034308510